MKTFYRTNR